MPFGMINSAATLKRAMKKLIEDLDNVDFYWDDILVHTRTWEEHIKALQELFARLMQKHDEKLFPFATQARNCQALRGTILQLRKSA